ncbi:hypothetical protein SLS62_002510 [Diatrype stigma]|uniref:Uncharacterized protein n=1 Tax=Diatrype stigma TaxID=117547 RepID=A0AAN9V0A5_9PEZI
MTPTKNATTVAATAFPGGRNPAVEGSSVGTPAKAIHQAESNAMEGCQEHADNSLGSVMDDYGADFWWADDESVWYDDESMDDIEFDSAQPEEELKVEDDHNVDIDLSSTPRCSDVAKKTTHKKPTMHHCSIRQWLDATDMKNAKKSSGNGVGFCDIPQYPGSQAGDNKDGLRAAETGHNHAYQPIRQGTQLPDAFQEVYNSEPYGPELSLAERMLKIEKRMLHAELVVLFVSGNEEAFASRLEYRRERFGSERLL